jgi:hypothetical protein
VNGITKSDIREVCLANAAGISGFPFFHDTVNADVLGPSYSIPGI